ncbi:hypothetical protein J2128_000362 [Methanomicrobium sp. W14]|uniref:hypothetical protein n=1 Tax=Methanomicrobium sp. W14 TaxID=2817839 RepID=UPI001AE81318|nr:hypothetical protein [Methanomicrobium sp. W14]MBP2132441.1 hypothetical protein [Methanomicrobium sp. W14]
MEAEKIRKYWHLINSDDEFVLKAFYYYNLDHKSPFGLYNIYEIIKDDLKDKGYAELYDKKLNLRYCTKRECKSFTNSVNSPEGVGLGNSRHASKSKKMSPKLKKMTVEEAGSFLNKIFWKWLEDKSESIKEN